jgi:hypothetical protein
MATAGFLTTLIISPSADSMRWRLERSFDFRTSSHLGQVSIGAAPGFMTDFASVPFPFRWLLPKWGRYGRAAVIHDWLYSQQMYSKEFADDAFLEGMTISKVSWLVRRVMYLAVSWFGAFAWYSAAARQRAGKRKFDTSGTLVPPAEMPQWDLPLGRRLAGMVEEWRRRPRH